MKVRLKNFVKLSSTSFFYQFDLEVLDFCYDLDPDAIKLKQFIKTKLESQGFRIDWSPEISLKSLDSKSFEISFFVDLYCSKKVDEFLNLWKNKIPKYKY